MGMQLPFAEGFQVTCSLAIPSAITFMSIVVVAGFLLTQMHCNHELKWKFLPDASK